MRANSTIIEHLQKLEKIGIIRGKKRGRERFYSIQWESVVELFRLDWVAFERDMIEEMKKQFREKSYHYDNLKLRELRIEKALESLMRF